MTEAGEGTTQHTLLTHSYCLVSVFHGGFAQVQAVLRGLGKLPQKARLCLRTGCNLFTVLPRVVLLADINVLSLGHSPRP